VSLHLQMTWCLPRRPATVTMARHLLDSALTLFGVSASCRDEIAIIVTEACTNAVRHAAGEDYEVRFFADRNRCVIEVVDSGPGLDGEQLDGAALVPDDVTAERGRGLLIIRAYSDEQRLHQRDRSGLTVRVSKNLTWEADPFALAPNLA